MLIRPIVDYMNRFDCLIDIHKAVPLFHSRTHCYTLNKSLLVIALRIWLLCGITSSQDCCYRDVLCLCRDMPYCCAVTNCRAPTTPEAEPRKPVGFAGSAPGIVGAKHYQY